MFEKDIELAPPGSDRKTSFIIAQGFAELLGGIESSLEELVVILHNDTFEDAPDEVDEEPFPHFEDDELHEMLNTGDNEVQEEPFPHFNTATHTGPVANTREVLEAPQEPDSFSAPDLTAAVDATIVVDRAVETNIKVAPVMHEHVVTKKVDLDYTVVEDEILPTEFPDPDQSDDPNVVFDNHTKNLRQEERELDPIAESFTRNTADES